jgi:short-subunit dehydrogenase involved in D-alanine esterification of teichoic acids
MQKIQPPGEHLVRPLLKHFQELLEFYVDIHGTQSASSIVARISSNFANLQNVLQNGLQQGHPDLKDSVYCTCHLNYFSLRIGQGPPVALVDQIYNMLPHLRDHELEACFVMELLDSTAILYGF